MAKRKRKTRAVKAVAATVAEAVQADSIRGDQELAKRFAVTTKTVYSWRQAGLPHTLEGRIAVYVVAEADEWVELHKRKAEEGLTPAARVRLQREEEKLRLDKLAADRKQREADAEAGNILRRDEWELWAIEVVQQARDRFMRMPTLLCKHVPSKYHRVLQHEGRADVRKICEEMARLLAQGARE